MKKYLFTSAAALAFCGLFTSCTHDLGYDESSAQNSVVKTYEQAFVTAFGQPDPNQEWGFGTSTAKAATRTITVSGDSYDAFNPPTQDEISAAFPSAIPSKADEVSDLLTLYYGKPYYNQYNPNATVGSLYDVYVGIVTKGFNLKITKTGEYELGASYMNLKDGEYQHYNVYVDVDGDVTIKRNGDTHFNLYVIRGNVTIPSDFGKMTGCISVGTGATLNDFRDNGGSGKNGHVIRYFNRGTYNAKNTNGFDLENDATFYNEKIFAVTGPMKYSAGSGNTCYFMSFGPDAVMTAPSMTLNSTCHFYTEGTVNITGETRVTQQAITWINNGHYTTGSMKFSAHNGTFYNYCQLKVNNCCIFTDGLFNMMDNSYAEFGTGLFNNFHVVMGNNSGFNVKNGTKWGMQGAGILQGFYAKNDNTTAYVRLAGENSVPAHKGSAFHVSGANLTLAYENMTFYQYLTFNAESYEGTTYSQVRTDEQPESNLANYHNVTKIITGDDFAKTGFTLKEGQCAATWKGKDPDPSSGVLRIICEDLSAKASDNENSDWDFNDVVFDIQLVDNDTKAKITLKAAGGTLPLCIGDVNHEVHELFAEANPDKNITTSTMINTRSTGAKYTLRDCNEAVFYLDIDDTWKAGANLSEDDGLLKAVAKNMPVQVYKMVSGTKKWVTMEAKKGDPAAKIAVGTDYNWCDERTDIRENFKADIINTSNEKFSTFKLYVKDILSEGWYNVTEVSQSDVNRY